MAGRREFFLLAINSHIYPFSLRYQWVPMISDILWIFLKPILAYILNHSSYFIVQHGLTTHFSSFASVTFTCQYELANWWQSNIPPFSIHWRHNERDGLSNHQPLECLLHRLFRCRSIKTSKLRVTGLCEGNPPVTGGLPITKGQ